MATVVPPLIVIAGPTASGKTALAIRLAEMHNGEIISADSRSIYRGMDIGTAKPTLEERARVPHWGIDIVNPDQVYTASDFKQYAVDKIAEIRRRGKVPFLVGGTGLYIDAVLYDYQFGNRSNPTQRAALETMTVEELQKHCSEHNVELPENQLNKRYLIRAIEVGGINHKRNDVILDNTMVVGIATDKTELRHRIRVRSEHIFANGVVDEARKLGKMYGWDSVAMTGNIYRLARKYIDGELSQDKLKEDFATKDWQLAKRQMTWLRRNKHLRWFNLLEAEHFIDKELFDYEQKCATV